MDKYCALDEHFPEFTYKLVNKENFVSQNLMLGVFIIWIHVFRNNKVYVLDCLHFLED